MASIATLKAQIKTLQGGIDSKITPENIKVGMRKTVENMLAKIAELEAKEANSANIKTGKKTTSAKAPKKEAAKKENPKKEEPKKSGKPNLAMKKAAELAKKLRSEDSSLTQPQAMKKAWEQVKGGSKPKKEDSGSGKKLSLAQFKKRYEDNEDKNYHSENVVLLAENFGTKEDVKEAKEILTAHDKAGHLTDSLRRKRDRIQKKLWAKYKAEEKGETPAKKSEAAKKKAKDLKNRVKSKLTPVPNQYKSGAKTHLRDKDRDGVRTAKPAGKRVSKRGIVYYEYRENRADANIGRKSYRKPKLFAKGGKVDDYTKELSMVEVKFADPKYNYKTNVSGNITEQEARKYFVGKMLDVGVYPKENMQKVIDIAFHPKGTYADGGSLGSEMYKIVDINGEDVHVNMTEKDIIEFADSLGYYDALDNEEEPIYDIDSATALIEMDGDYTVIKVSKEGDSFGRGGNTGNYNTGRSWHQDRNLFAQGQDYEVQYRKHRKA